MEEIALEVIRNVFLITFVLLTVYPVIYIVRSMVDFITKAFSHININKVFKINTVDIGQKQKSKWEKEF